jgi:GH15 family glucan-1,4-alpha-glucosidase
VETNEHPQVRLSVESILRHQSENGAIVASTDFSQYGYCWLRDGSFCALALDLAGEHAASARYHSWVNNTIEGIAGLIDSAIEKQLSGENLGRAAMPPTRFALDGSMVKDDWPNFQIDGYGTWLWSLGKHLNASGTDTVPAELIASVQRVSRYLAAFALTPCYDVWEEFGTAVSTSTLACVYGGLAAAARLLDDDVLAQCAETVKSRVLEQAASGDYIVKSNVNDDVDASLLWLATPFQLVTPTDPKFLRTVSAIEDRLNLEGGVRRYRADVYFGSGAWPVLTASLGLHYLDVGDVAGANRCLEWIEQRFNDEGQLGEQYFGELRDPEHYREWLERWGPSAIDLSWSHAMYVILALALEEVAAQESLKSDA